MKKLTLIRRLIIRFITNGFSSHGLLTKVKFASLEKANELLKQEDAFIKRWSQFDIDSRMQKQASTKEELLNYIGKQVRDWTLDEKNKIRSIFKRIDEKIVEQGFKLDFPDVIYLVKTTAKEEGDAGGYTRANYIVLQDEMLFQSQNVLEQLILHKLFHILTRNKPEFRKEMYKIIGFSLMNELAYPKVLKAYRITNPDAPQTDSYITLKVGDESKHCMMILYSNQAYEEGDFFNYLNVGFLSLKGDALKTLEYKDDKPVIYTFEELSGFFEQVGKNTRYIIHPEEILADNFSFAVLNKPGLPNSEIVDEIKKKLRNS